MNNEILNTAQKVVTLLKEKGLKIATAESCTGGMVSAYLTAVSGASQVFELGVTSYSNDIKNRILNVVSQTLEDFGAISENTAKQMAQNVRKIANSDIGVSVTGVAGPTSQEGHPVGTVFIGISDKYTTKTKKLEIPPLDRNIVREQAVSHLLTAVINHLNETSLKEKQNV